MSVPRTVEAFIEVDGRRWKVLSVQPAKRKGNWAEIEYGDEIEPYNMSVPIGQSEPCQ